MGLEFAFSSGDSGVPGTGDSIPGAKDRTQSNVTDILKGQMQESPGWGAAHQAGYGELIPGIPFVPNIIFQIADQLFDLTPLGPFFNLTDIMSLVTGSSILDGIIPGLDASKIISGEFPVEMISGLIEWLQNAPVNAANLFGTIASELLSVVSVGALTTESPNRVPNPNFTADAIPDNSGGFSVDMSMTRTADGSGTAMIVADGQPHALNTGDKPGDKMTVAPGQRIPCTIYVAHWGAITSGNGPPAVLQLRPYNGDTPLPLVDLYSYTPAAADVPLPGFPMVGEYRVPETGVTHVQQQRVYVTEHALGGVWRFDDARTTQEADVSTFPGVGQALQILDQKGDAILDAISSAAAGFPLIGGGIAQLTQAIKSFNPANILGPLGAPNIGGDFQSIINMLVGGLRGKPVTSDASVADIYSAASQASTNIAGADVTDSFAVSTVIPVEAWADWIDPVGVGHGGNGLGLGIIGFGGGPGKWNSTTWQRGVHYTGAVSVTVTFNSNGSVTISIPGYSITCAAGPAASPFSGGAVGVGPGPYVYNSGNFVGGGNQNTPGGPGLAPGGGGAGGGIFQPGGVGAPGRAWVRRRAAVVPGQSTGSDVTAPSLPTPVILSATIDSLVLQGTGSVDG